MRIDVPDPTLAQIELHFQQALALDAQPREAWLAELHGTLPAVAQAVRDRLADHQTLDAASLRAPSLTTPTEPRTSEDRWREAAVVGPYRLLQQIGAGGMSSVWLAERCDDQPRRQVALKLPYLGMSMQAERFRRECELLATLSHPNIARLYDMGVTHSGQPYLAMELVDGIEFLDYCDQRRLTIRERLRLFLSVLEAVQFAHAQLIIHRDLKPSNILVTAEGRAVLIDFGIGKLLTAGETQDTQFARALTPEYASPEQFVGKPLGAASDIYSLGVILYELLTGSRPHRLWRESTTAADQVHLTDALRRPSQTTVSRQVATSRGTSLRSLVGLLSGDLDTIILKCLKVDPSQRYPSISAFGQDIANHLQNLPISARPDSFGYRCRKFIRRNRKAIAAGVLLLLAIIAGVTGTLVQAQRARAQAQEAKLERDSAVRMYGYARAGNELMGFLLQESADTPLTPASLLDRAAPLVTKQFAHDPELQAYLQLTLSVQYSQAGQNDRAEELLISARANRKSIHDSVLLAEIDCQLGSLQIMGGAAAEGQRLLDAAIAELRRESVPNNILLASCLQARAEYNATLRNPKAALSDAREALSLLDAVSSAERTQVIVAQATLGRALDADGQLFAASAQYQRALKALAQMGRENSRMTMGLYNNLGVLLARSGQTLAAFQTYERANAVAQGLGQLQPVLAGNYAFSLADLGRGKEAAALLERAFAEAQQQGDPRTATLLKVRGASAWCVMGDFEQCSKLLKSARTELPSILPPGNTRFAMLDLEEARMELARGDRDRARNYLQSSLEIFQQATSPNPYEILALALLARVEVERGALDNARGHIDQAVAKARGALAGFEHSQWLGQALLSQALLERARGEHPKALASLQSALAEFDGAAGPTGPATIEARKLIAKWQARIP
jgi:serine/threonine-protein kinase